jgi:transposase-like protein
MVAHVIACPHCHQAESVIRHGTNRGGTARCRCKDCNKTFTPAPNPRRTSPERQEQVLRALSERLSIAAVARMFSMSRQTLYHLLKKNGRPAGVGNDAA